MRRLRFLLFVTVLGGLWRLYEYQEWLSLSGYRVEAQEPALEQRFWESFPARSLRFWPFLLWDSEGTKDFLERTTPVLVSTRMAAFGRFVTMIRRLEPWLKLRWRGTLYFLSREGRMWGAEEPGALFVDLESVKGPVWQLAALSDDVQPLPAGVFRSPVSLDRVIDFLQEYQHYAWFDAVEEAVWDRRAGTDLFRLKLVRGKQTFEVLVQQAKYGGQELGAMLEEVLGKLAREGGNHRIDATYEGKIVLKKLPGGPNEGSLK